MNCDVERKQDSGTRAMTMFSYVHTLVNKTSVKKNAFFHVIDLFELKFLRSWSWVLTD